MEGRRLTRVEVLDPIEPGDLDKVGLRNAARTAIAEALERGKGEAREAEVVAASSRLTATAPSLAPRRSPPR